MSTQETDATEDVGRRYVDEGIRPPQDAHDLTAYSVRDLLLSVSSEIEAQVPSVSEIRQWDQRTRNLAGDWAVAVYNDIERPRKPAVLEPSASPTLHAPWVVRKDPQGKPVVSTDEKVDRLICRCFTPMSYLGDRETNARLIAAAGTAAHELPDEYDPIEAVRASSDVFPALKKFVGQGGDHAPRCGYKIGYACDCGLQDLKDALASAQDDGN